MTKTFKQKGELIWFAFFNFIHRRHGTTVTAQKIINADVPRVLPVPVEEAVASSAFLPTD